MLATALLLRAAQCMRPAGNVGFPGTEAPRRRCASKATSSIQPEAIMKVREAMTTEVGLARPEEPIREAARTMASIDSGALPVRAKNRLIGMITDRDIAVRAVAAG